jgi:hypothetical protein
VAPVPPVAAPSEPPVPLAMPAAPLGAGVSFESELQALKERRIQPRVLRLLVVRILEAVVPVQ